MYNLEYLQNFFKDDLFAMKQLGAKIIEAHDDIAKCMFDVTKDHQNAKGFVMGGAIFTLADITFAVATNQHEEYYTVTTNANISYLRPCMSKSLYSEAVKIRDGKTTCFYDIFIKDFEGNLITKVSVVGNHISK